MAALGSGGAPSGPVALAVVVGHPETTAFALAVDAALAVAAAVYVVSARRLRREEADGRRPRPRHGWSPWRVAAFLSGLLLAYVAIGSGLAAYSARPSIVVAQHVLLMMAAPPLLVLGRPVALWRAAVGGPGEPRRRAGAAVGHGAEGSTSPLARRGALAVWVLYYGSMAGFFLTPLFPGALHDPGLLDASELWFAAVGLAFALYVVGGAAAPGGPSFWVRLAAILAGAPAETAVGLALLLWPHPLAPGVTLATTHTAGLVLWAGGMLTSGLSLAYVLGLWVLDDSRRGAELDLVLDAAVVPVSLGDGPGSGRPSPR
jgi:putative membrane protein